MVSATLLLRAAVKCALSSTRWGVTTPIGKLASAHHFENCSSTRELPSTFHESSAPAMPHGNTTATIVANTLEFVKWVPWSLALSWVISRNQDLGFASSTCPTE